MIQATELLAKWLESRLSDDEWSWLSSRFDRANDLDERKLHITLGLIPRKLSREDLLLSESELAAANEARPGWDPSQWSIDAAARILVLSQLAERNPDSFAEQFKVLCQTADLSESIALYTGTSVFPNSDTLDAQIGEGLRTNMRAVFEAIAHRSPYPAQYFDEHRWNHMVLKALFIDSTLAPIQGLDSRANEELAVILCNYAHERWAADRQVTHELWRCVGPFARDRMLEDLKRVAVSENPVDRGAAALALSQSPDPEARKILELCSKEVAEIAAGHLTWDSLHNAGKQ